MSAKTWGARQRIILTKTLFKKMWFTCSSSAVCNRWRLETCIYGNSLCAQRHSSAHYFWKRGWHGRSMRLTLTLCPTQLNPQRLSQNLVIHGTVSWLPSCFHLWSRWTLSVEQSSRDIDSIFKRLFHRQGEWRKSILSWCRTLAL